MARINVRARSTVRTYEGGPAAPLRPVAELQRMVASCLLFEDAFYEGGNSLANRIKELCKVTPAADVAALAIKAREEYNLRHVPLFLTRELARNHRGTDLVSFVLSKVIRRADELSEFLAMYWKDGRQPLSAQVKKGLAQAFTQFSEYNLAKYNRDNEIKLRDVMFLVHPKPINLTQAQVWKRLVNGTLATPDTWEVALSAGADKRATFERLLAEGKMGALAVLRNLRNMTEAGVNPFLVRESLGQLNTNGVLPSQFVAAYRYAPQYADAIESLYLRGASYPFNLPGHTALIVDVSGSMQATLSERSQISRMDAAAALAMLMREVCQSVRVFSFSNMVVEIPNLRGFGLLEAIERSQPNQVTHLGAATRVIRQQSGYFNRVIVVTDEQSQDGISPAWADHSYLVNCAPYSYGLDTTQGWTRINGLSDRVVEWIITEEAN